MGVRHVAPPGPAPVTHRHVEAPFAFETVLMCAADRHLHYVLHVAERWPRRHAFASIAMAQLPLLRFCSQEVIGRARHRCAGSQAWSPGCVIFLQSGRPLMITSRSAASP